MSDNSERRVDERFRILVCIDGSEESYRGLRYAAKLGGGVDADIVLCYVRPFDQGMRSGGLQVNVARENMLNWGLELPGIKHLKKGRDMLVDLGILSLDWSEKHYHTDVEGTSLGDNKIDYISPEGKKIVLKLKVTSNIATGILDQWALGEYDLIILGASERWRSRKSKSFWDPAVAEKVALHAPCSVIVSRSITEGNGHLICTDGSDISLEMVRRDAYLASRCNCPISILSVAHHESAKADAEAAVEQAADLLAEMDIPVIEKIIKVGNPVEQIIETGPDYSLVVVADSGKGAIERFFIGSTAFKVMELAYNSVMIVR